MQARERLVATLDQNVSILRLNMFAESTRKTYQSQQSLYLEFCKSLCIPPVPISPVDLGRYVAFLASKLCYSSVKQYLNIVRLMHLDEGYPSPLANSWYLSSILQGLRRCKGDNAKQKLPITINILRQILSILNLSCAFDLTFWATCLVAFFSFFRKSNLLITAWNKFNPDIHLCRSDALFHTSGAILSVRWSKTIQFRQKTLQVPLPRIKNSPFCPSAALMLCLSNCPSYKGPLPLFSYSMPGGTVALTHTAFVSYLRKCLLKTGLDPAQFSGHSFRRGGASFALQCGIPADWIKLQGDWASNAYERYLDPSLSFRKQLASKMGRAFQGLLDRNQK